MPRTIYKVEGNPRELSARPRGWQRIVAKSPRRVWWILLALIVVTVAMIIAIAALSATESSAGGTGPSSSFSSLGSGPFITAVAVSSSAVSSSVSEGATSTSSRPSTTYLTETTLLAHAIEQPARIVIPALNVDAKIVPVGLKDGGDMEIPEVGIVGWFELGPVPGGAGPAVLVSHVSWNGKKGAFYGLKDLKQGDEVQVYGKSGDYAVFQVDYSETILKSQLPTERIWNDTNESVIRLVTCGGEYDPNTRHYLSNVIIYGHLVK